MLHALIAPLLALNVYQSAPPELRRAELMAALRGGGYTVILRHARTDRSFQEVREYVPKERSAQRNLNDDGMRDAALMGVVFRKHGVAFAEVIASPMYRTVETAGMAARAPDTTMVLRVFPPTPEQAALVNRPPKGGTNRLLVTHHFVIETHVPGIRPGDIAESEAAVVRHIGGKVELVGRITLDDWRVLANPSAAVAAAAPATPTGVSAASAPTSTPAVSSAASAGASSASLPDTHAGHLAKDYIAAFNTGDRDKMRAFIESSMQANPDRSIEQRLDLFMKLFEEHGPLSLHGVLVSESTELTLAVISRRGPVRVTVKSSEAQPMRVSSITFAVMEGSHR